MLGKISIRGLDGEIVVLTSTDTALRVAIIGPGRMTPSLSPAFFFCASISSSMAGFSVQDAIFQPLVKKPQQGASLLHRGYTVGFPRKPSQIGTQAAIRRCGGITWDPV